MNGKKMPSSDSKNPLEQLEEFFEPFSQITTQKSFCGGLIGYFGTDSAHYFDADIPQSSHDSPYPTFQFGLYLDGLIFDRKRQKLEYFTWHEDRSEHILDVLHQSQKSPQKFTSEYLSSSCTEQEYEEMVTQMQEEIVDGNIFQIVPSRQFEYRISGSAVPFYMRLRELNPSPHMYYLKFGETEIIGSSPELVARVNGERIETFPIAGTRSRGDTPQEDAALAAEMLNDEKEVAEHMMLVDMARNDLGRVCVHGSVQVDRLMSIKKFSHVQHIVSEVSGILQPKMSTIHAVLANFPMGTVCGSPRIEAIKILHRHEQSARGPYGGAVGFWSFSGDATFALAIRTLFRHQDIATVQAGAGVVFDSVPEFERKEVEKKAAHLQKILSEFAK